MNTLILVFLFMRDLNISLTNILILTLFTQDVFFCLKSNLYQNLKNFQKKLSCLIIAS